MYELRYMLGLVELGPSMCDYGAATDHGGKRSAKVCGKHAAAWRRELWCNLLSAAVHSPRSSDIFTAVGTGQYRNKMQTCLSLYSSAATHIFL